jgi:hypothetical protein
VQSTVFPADDHFHGTLYWIDAFNAGGCSVGDNGHPLFQLRKGRQEGRARVVDPRQGLMGALGGGAPRAAIRQSTPNRDTAGNAA